MHLRTTLLERIERARPRVIRVIADAGWGKSAFVRALTARAPDAVVVEARDADGGEGFEGLALDALSAFGDAAAIGTLRDLWAAAGIRLFAVEDVHLLEDEDVDLVRMLLRALPADCTVVLTSRTPLPFELSRYFAPHEIVTVGPEDLALTDAEQRAVLGDELDERTLKRALHIAHGWPIATYLFGRLAREGRLAALLDRLEDRAFDDLHAYIDNEILAAISADDLDVLLLCSCAGTIGSDDLGAVLGDGAHARFARLSAQRVYLSGEEGRCRALPVVAAALLRSRPEAVAVMAERCAAARDERGDHNGAATMWLANGNPLRAVASLDRLGPPPAGSPIAGRHLRLLLRLPLDAVLLSRHVFTALLTSPHVYGTPYALLAEASTICDRFAGDASVDSGFRASARLALAVASAFASRPRRAEEALDLIEAERRDAPLAPERAEMFVATRACVWAMLGRLADAAAAWRSLPLEDAQGRTMFASHRLELRLACAFGAGEQQSIVAELAAFVALARDSGDALAIAHARVLDEIFARTAGGGLANAEVILSEIEREELADTDPAAYGHIVRAADLPPERHSRLSCMYLGDMAYEQDDALTARRMLEAAVVGSDRIGGLHMQIVTRMLLAFVPGASQARLFEEARRIANNVQHPNTLASVEALADGRFTDAVSFPFVARRVASARFAVPAQALHVEILRGRVTRAGAAVPMRSREFEVLAALALARVPVPRIALASRLWGEDEAEDAAPALRTAIHRLRKQLGDSNSVIFENSAYRIGRFVTVDVHDIESALAGFRRLNTLTDRERERLLDISVALAVDPPELYDDWDWMAPHLAHIVELRHRAAILLGEEALAGGSPDDAVAVADTVLRLDPLDEPLLELAVRALLAAGRRAEAVRRARRYADDLARELGGDPSSQLLRTLAAGEPQHAATG